MKRTSLHLTMSMVEAKMKSRMGRNLLAPSTNGPQQRSNHLVFLETENDPPQKSRPRRKFRPRDGTQSQREDKEIQSIKRKIESSAEALKKLRVHVDDGNCPRTLRHNVPEM